MKKVSEVYIKCTNVDESVFYGGFYHLCGRLIAEKSTWVKSNSLNMYVGKTYKITNGFRIYFQEDCALVSDGFPNPVIQLEISANIPWVLNEKNNYPKG